MRRRRVWLPLPLPLLAGAGRGATAHSCSRRHARASSTVSSSGLVTRAPVSGSSIAAMYPSGPHSHICPSENGQKSAWRSNTPVQRVDQSYGMGPTVDALARAAEGAAYYAIGRTDRTLGARDLTS